jgi:hypothetical protein
MRSTFVVPVTTALLILAPSLVRAQESGRVGISMGYPTAVGVVWHISDAIAVRPEVSFTTTTADVTLTTSSSTTYGVGVSGLFYVKRWDALRAYVSPRYTYQHGSSTSTLAINLPIALPIDLPSIETTTRTAQHTISGSFGAQYLAHEHFAVFGELGAGYSTLKLTADTSVPQTGLISNPTAHSFGVRSSAGVIFYF